MNKILSNIESWEMAMVKPGHEGHNVVILESFCDGWDLSSLIDLAREDSDIVGGPFGSNLKVSDYRTSGIPIIRLQNIDRNKFINKNIKYISQEKANELRYHSFRAGDVVLAKLGDPIGKTCMIPDYLREGIVTADIVRIRTIPEKTHKEFIVYALNSNFCLEQFCKHKTGTTRPRVNVSDVRNLKILLPPLPEQQRIAYVLSTVQEARDKTQAVIEAAREMKKSLMKHLFTYGPVPLAEASKVPLKDTEIGMVPEGWNVAMLGDSAKIVSGGTPSRKNPEYWNGDIPWVKTGEVNYRSITKTEEKISKKGLEESSTRIIPSGSLLMAMYGEGVTRGRVSILGIDAAINQACAAIFPFNNLYTYFLFYLFSINYEQIRNLGFGANQKNLSATLIKTIKIPIPPLPEQQQIADILVSVDKNIEANENKKKALDTIFQTLLQNLMTGKIRVNHQVMLQ